MVEEEVSMINARRELIRIWHGRLIIMEALLGEGIVKQRGTLIPLSVSEASLSRSRA